MLFIVELFKIKKHRMKYLQLTCLMLIFGTNIWSQETIRFFKQDFDVSKYQNEEIDF